MKILLKTLCCLSLPLVCVADDGYGPVGSQHAPSAYQVPVDLVPGGAFIDRILPIPLGRGAQQAPWGGKNVQPRVVENGIEDPAWSYWCMSVHREADGLYHMFTTRWPEADPRGHNAWPESQVVRATATSPTGPFTVKQEIGSGHNVMSYRAKEGTYVLYVIDGAYTSKSLEGPWAKAAIEYDRRGTPEVVMSNHTFASREDGSVLMVSRGGHVWISEDGLKPFRKITCESMFPKIPGAFEDPIVWRDEVQYHLIVNDWHGRTAFYLRSADGVDWVWDEGKAYDIEVARHPDGTKEGWHKLERPNVLQDKYGRATHLYLAAMDAPKDLDRGSDKHSSKVLVLPLSIERRMEILPGTEGGKVRVKVLAEEGLDPAALDTASLRFGPPAEVNRGRGAKAVAAEPADGGVILTFESMGGEFSKADPVAKLLGKTKDGSLVLGHVRTPNHQGLTAILSPQPPRFTEPGKLVVKVENFGLKPSAPTTLKVTLSADGQEPIVLSAPLPALAPYAGTEIVLDVDAKRVEGKSFKVETVAGEPGAASVLHTNL